MQRVRKITATMSEEVMKNFSPNVACQSSHESNSLQLPDTTTTAHASRRHTTTIGRRPNTDRRREVAAGSNSFRARFFRYWVSIAKSGYQFDGRRDAATKTGKGPLHDEVSPRVAFFHDFAFVLVADGRAWPGHLKIFQTESILQARKLPFSCSNSA